ncbi:MAG: right-handed parallel beta-helix repeat-containing protein [Terrimicrobiaceae bacterium]|nr:right-handed parallel beta-helix repeat-containing protein [Terrimicrobiaceae bacterium]
MKKLIVTLLLAPAVHAGTVIHVSPDGRDTGSGRADAPFQTITRARDQIRSLKAEGQRGPFTIEMAPGTYAIRETIEFLAQDSGYEESPVTYRSSSGRSAILKGGRTVPLSQFTKVSDPAIVARLDESARNHVLALSLDKSGIEHDGPFPPVFRDRGGIFELFDGKGRLPLSRWPNEGYTTMGPVLSMGDKNVGGSFQFKDDRPLRWLNNPDVWLKGQWRVGWEDPAIRVEKIEAGNRTITFAAGIPNGIGSKYHRPTDGSPIGSGKEPWAAINLIEEIDMPGEWALDFSSRTLFVWPREGSDELIITQLDVPLIAVNDASWLRFENLTLEHSLGDGIVLHNVDHCLVAGLTVRNIAGRGIVMEGTESGVLSCDVNNIGEGAIYVAGGDRKSLTMSNNFVINNHVHHYGLLKRQYSAGVHVGVMDNPAGGNMVRDAVGIRIAHNVLHHAPRDAFLYSGNDNIYEFNEVYYCGFDTKDTGAWYSWLDWTMRGNVIRHNYVHNTIGGVNPDDGASGNLAYGNVFVGPNIGVWIASGPDNIIRHNIFVKDQGPVFAIDDRGVGRGYATNPRLINRVKELNPSEEPWRSAHPELATMLENRPELPWRTQFVENLIVQKVPGPLVMNKMSKASQGVAGLLEERDNLVVTEDPGFVDAAAGNFGLRPQSEVFSRIPGFQPIPFEQIGLYIDGYRTVLPTEEERMRAPKYSPYRDDQDEAFGT